MLKIVARSRARIAKLIAGEGVPYGKAMKLVRGKEVKLNGKRVNADIMCEKGDFIEVYLPQKTPPAAVYADENLAIFNKPAGVETDDFLSLVRLSYPSAAAVHRLDRNTRGILVVALNKIAEAELKRGFKERTFSKYYLAEVKGVPEPKAAYITAYLEKDSDLGTVYIHDRRQKNDVEIATAYTVLSSGGATSVLEVELVTGRTHQIRAHLAHIGHPIIGDGKYGDGELNKRLHAKVQRLQAYRIVFHFKDGPLQYLDGREFKVKAEIGKDEEE